MNSNKQTGVILAVFGLVVLILSLNERILYRIGVEAAWDMQTLGKVLTYAPIVGLAFLVLGAIVFVTGLNTKN